MFETVSLNDKKRKSYWVWILAGILGLVAVSYYFLQKGESQKTQTTFNFLSHEMVDQLDEQFKLFVEKTHDLENAIAINKKLSDEDFRRLADDYIHANQDTKLVAWASLNKKDESFVITQQNLNQKKISIMGVDLSKYGFFKTHVYQTNSGKPDLSIQLSDIDDQYKKDDGILLFVPVYRGRLRNTDPAVKSNLLGFIVVVIDLEAVARKDFPESSHINFAIFDPTSPVGERRIYPSKQGPASTNEITNSLKAVRSLRVGDDFLFVVAYPNEKLFQPVFPLSILVFFMGMIISIALAVYFKSHENILLETLIQAKESAQQASKVKSEFLANMSHEIRTPLNVVIGMTDMLMDSGLNEDQKKCAEIVLSSAHSLLSIINDILDFSKIETGKMELEQVPFNLKLMIEDHLQPLRHVAEKNGLYFRHSITELSSEVYGDPGRLGQVLTNLIGNAIKFTKEGGVSIICEVEEDFEDKIKINFSIRDTGIGIPDEARERIFQSFSQADRSTSRKYGGSGLGLSIVKKIITLMGGSIRFESMKGVGTSFLFTLEFRKGKIVEQIEQKIKVMTEISLLEGRILVAEDVTTNQQLFARILKKFGCRYQVVSNGREAIEALEANSYDAILMDCQMPEMDGYEATRMIRKALNPKLLSIPIIALTANAIKGDREKCIEAGMNDYLTKPISQAKLYEILSKYLKQQTA